MSEDGESDVRLCAPVQLTDDGSMSHQFAPPSPHHRTSYGCAVTDIDVNPAKHISGLG